MSLSTFDRTLPPPASTTPDDGWLIRCCERGWLPDMLIRLGMRQLMGHRLRDEAIHDGELRARRLNHLLDDLRSSPIAIETQAANAQHYEVPASFFHAHLGPHLKYSCCLYPEGKETLAQAETAMLELYATRAELVDGQRAFIEGQAAERGLTNLKAVTGNIVDFEFSEALLAGGFDRVVSIEMFEHMKNYGLLLAEIARWMRDDAKLFVHIFAHRTLAYHFQVQDGSDWMSKYFFTGGTMPSENLLLNFQDDLRMERQWWVSGTHYERTANQWLAALDAAKDRVLPMLVDTYGARDAALWLQRWRMFYMAVAELFGYANGNEWGVGHYRFEKR